MSKLSAKKEPINPLHGGQPPTLLVYHSIFPFLAQLFSLPPPPISTSEPVQDGNHSFPF